MYCSYGLTDSLNDGIETVFLNDVLKKEERGIWQAESRHGGGFKGNR